jgi:hypothetical protein
VATLKLDYCRRRKKKLREMVQRKTEKPLAIASIIFAFISALGLILLTMFDSFKPQYSAVDLCSYFLCGSCYQRYPKSLENRITLQGPHPESQLLSFTWYSAVVFEIFYEYCKVALNKILNILIGGRKELH